MKEIIVLAEHRRGELRDVTWEMLSKSRQLAESRSAELGVALLGKGMNSLADALKPKVKRVLLIEDPRLEAFNPETYKKVLTQLIIERKPLLTLIGHTAMGMDYAPRLAASLEMPLATDCIGIEVKDETFSLTRQIYGGKVNVEVSFLKKGPYMVTRVGLLGTRFTMEQDFYRGRLEQRHGLDVVVPEPGAREMVHRVIYAELCRGLIRDSSRAAYRGIIEHLVKRDAQGIIAGCTEIELLVREEDSAAPLFPTTRIHAVAAVDRALQGAGSI